MYGDGSAERDYTYVEDTVDGICRSLNEAHGSNGAGFEILNLGANRTVRLRELIQLLGEALDAVPNVQQLPPQPGDVPRTWADVTRARELLGYEPKISIEEGLRRFVAWYLARHDLTTFEPSSAQEKAGTIAGQSSQ